MNMKVKDVISKGDSMKHREVYFCGWVWRIDHINVDTLELSRPNGQTGRQYITAQADQDVRLFEQ